MGLIGILVAVGCTTGKRTVQPSPVVSKTCIAAVGSVIEEDTFFLRGDFEQKRCFSELKLVTAPPALQPDWECYRAVVLHEQFKGLIVSMGDSVWVCYKNQEQGNFTGPTDVPGPVYLSIDSTTGKLRRFESPY